MEIWSIWVIIALGFVIVEIFTAGFGVLCFSFGCLAAAPVSLIEDSLIWQILAFSVVSLICFIYLRPVLLRLLHKESEEGDTRTNVDAIIGRQCFVSEEIPEGGFGRVKVDGDEWKAKSNDGSAIAAGATVEIISRESIIITVKEIIK